MMRVYDTDSDYVWVVLSKKLGDKKFIKFVTESFNNDEIVAAYRTRKLAREIVKRLKKEDKDWDDEYEYKIVKYYLINE